MRPRFSSTALLFVVCLLLTAGLACTGTKKAIPGVQSHPDSLAHAFVRMCQRKAWDELGSLVPTLKEQKAMFRSLERPTDEIKAKPQFPASQAAVMDTVAAEGRRKLDLPLFDWPQVRLEQVRPDGSPQRLGSVVEIQRYVLRLRFPNETLLQSITVWKWEGRHFLAGFERPRHIEGQ
jgi:hypothetical protein